MLGICVEPHVACTGPSRCLPCQSRESVVPSNDRERLEGTSCSPRAQGGAENRASRTLRGGETPLLRSKRVIIDASEIVAIPMRRGQEGFGDDDTDEEGAARSARRVAKCRARCRGAARCLGVPSGPARRMVRAGQHARARTCARAPGVPVLRPNREERRDGMRILLDPAGAYSQILVTPATDDLSLAPKANLQADVGRQGIELSDATFSKSVMLLVFRL